MKNWLSWPGRGLNPWPKCRSLGIKPVWVVYDRRDPAGIGERILTRIGQNTPLMLDISGMSRLLIVQLLVALGRRLQGYANCTLIYTEAKEYPPSQDEFKLDRDTASEADPAFIFMGCPGVSGYARINLARDGRTVYPFDRFSFFQPGAAETVYRRVAADLH